MAAAIRSNANDVHTFLQADRDAECARLLALANQIGFDELKKLHAPFGELRGAKAMKQRA
jgi:hypothetical protein